MAIRKLLRNRGLGINLIAGFSFLLLAVYGWGLKWKELAAYLLIIIVLLFGVIALAAVCGWLLRKAMGSGDVSSDRGGELPRVEKDSTNNKHENTKNTEVSIIKDDTNAKP